jgi:hypothetical protein
MSLFNIFNPLYMTEQIFGKEKNTPSSSFSILRLMAKGNNWGFGELSYLFVADSLIKIVALMHFYHQRYHKRMYLNVLNSEKGKVKLQHMNLKSSKDLNVNIIEFIHGDETSSILFRENRVLDSFKKLSILPAMVPKDISVFTGFSRQLKSDMHIYVQASIAEPPSFVCRSGTFARLHTSLINNSMHKKLLVGSRFKPKNEITLGRTGRDRSQFLTLDPVSSIKSGPPSGYNLFENGILGDIINEKGSCLLELPNYSRLVSDCAKM